MWTDPGARTASESPDVGADLGPTVADDHHPRPPFAFHGRIGSMRVRLGE